MRTEEGILHLFEGYGIEVEYMIVHRNSLDISSVSDEILRSAAGDYVNEFDNGEIGWSNEFVLHVIELRNINPISAIASLEPLFQEGIAHINNILKPLGGMLMPGSMHPWMDPKRDAMLWPHENRMIYETYDRIFNCRRHGWANIQSMQLNLPFNGDDEFERLVAAIRPVLPLIPALAASSPFQEGKRTGTLDTRILHYRDNQRLIPSITGMVIPELTSSRSVYRNQILAPMFRDVAPYDPEGLLQHEWLNSRGAIPRFDRNAIEIRLPDIQEAVGADLAVASVIAAAVRNLIGERWSSSEEQRGWDTLWLSSLLDDMSKTAEETLIRDEKYLKLFGFPSAPATAGELWMHLADEGIAAGYIEDQLVIDNINRLLEAGPLARRLMRAAGSTPSRVTLQEIYRELCDCLAEGRLFHA
jgi:carboxylate-amine ligase